MSQVDVAIIGAGPAGISAGIWAQSLELRYTLLESAAVMGGQLRRVYNRIVDYAGEPAQNGTELADRLLRHAESLGVTIRPTSAATSVDLERGVVATDSGSYDTRFVVLGTGVRARVLGVPGEAEFVGRGVSPSASRYAEQFRDRRVLVVGGGDAAFEEALILAEVCSHVTLMHRTDRFRSRVDFRNRVASHPRIDLVEFGDLLAIEGADAVERARVRLRGVESTLEVEGVFVCAGVVPNSELVASLVPLDPRGYVTVDAQMRTSHERLYAVGDVRSGSSLTIAAAVGEAATAIKDIQRRLTAASAEGKA